METSCESAKPQAKEINTDLCVSPKGHCWTEDTSKSIANREKNQIKIRTLEDGEKHVKKVFIQVTFGVSEQRENQCGGHRAGNHDHVSVQNTLDIAEESAKKREEDSAKKRSHDFDNRDGEEICFITSVPPAKRTKHEILEHKSIDVQVNSDWNVCFLQNPDEGEKREDEEEVTIEPSENRLDEDSLVLSRNSPVGLLDTPSRHRPPSFLSLPESPKMPTTEKENETSTVAEAFQKISVLEKRVEALEALYEFFGSRRDPRNAMENRDQLGSTLGAFDSTSSKNGEIDSKPTKDDTVQNDFRNSNQTEDDVMIELVKGYNLKIKNSDLKMALAIGRHSKKNFKLMVNKLLESVYTRAYMCEHTWSGPSKRYPVHLPLKEKLPEEDVMALTLYVIQVWKLYHGETANPNDVWKAIRIKLGNEAKAQLKINQLNPNENQHISNSQ